MPRLERRAKVSTVPVSAKRILRRGPQVWLAPGHNGPVSAHQPVVVVTHGTPWTNEPALWELVDHAYARQFIAATEAALQSADFVIVPSEYARAALLAGYPFSPDRVVTVQHGVDSTVFNPLAARNPGIGGSLADSMPYLLFVSAPAPQKNLDLLMLATDRLIQRGHPHALVIAGASEPSAQEPLGQLVERLPSLASRIAWLGRVEDQPLAGLMARADAFCLPSRMESFGLSALEALACGAPVVVSNRGALPEVVGDAALRTEPSVDGIEAALESVLGDAQLARQLRAAGPARARQMTWDRTTAGWLEVLERAAATPPGDGRRDQSPGSGT